MAVDLNSIGGLIESVPHNENYDEIKTKVESAQSDIIDLNSNKAEKGNVYTKAEIDDLKASDINNDASGVDGVKVSNALTGLNNRISNIIAQSGTSDTEVVDARYDSVNDILYTLLKLRLDAMSTNINTNASDININTGNINTNASDIVNIELKTDFISVTQVVDLDDMETDIEGNTINISTNETDIIELQDTILSDAYSPIVQSFENVQSVPSETLDAPILHESKGLSVVNSVENATVETSITSDGGETLIDINTDGTLEFQTIYDATNQIFNITTNDLMFAYMKILPSSVGDIRDYINIKYSDNSFDSVGNNSVGFNEVYGTITATKTLSANVKFREGNVGQIDRDYQWFINMTALGLTDILTEAGYTTDSQQEEAMLNIVRNLDASTTDIQSAVVDYLSVGKNLFPFADGIYSSNDELIVPLDGNEQYSFKATGYYQNGFSWSLRFNYTDGTHDVLSFATTTEVTHAFSSNILKKVVSAKIAGNPGGIDNIVIRDVQLELGAVATEYSPYQQNTLQSDKPLRSVPSTRDSLRNAVLVDGVYKALDKPEHVKRIESYVLESGDILSVSDKPNVTIAVANISSLDGAKTFINGTGAVLNANYTEIVNQSTTDLTTDQIGCWFTSPTGSIIFVLTLGTNITDARTLLTGEIIDYELATPIITQLTIDELWAFENGTIYNNSISQLDYVTSQNKSAVLTRLNETVERIDDDYASKVQEVKIEPTLLNSWVNFSGYAPLSYYKDTLGRIQFEGVIKLGTVTKGTILFILPEKYRPSELILLTVQSYSSSIQVSGIEINTDGEVLTGYDVGNVYLSLDGISFRAEEV